MNSNKVFAAKDIMSLYMEYYQSRTSNEVLVSDFCVKNDIPIGDFKLYFQSIGEIEQAIWHFMLAEAIDTLLSDAEYDSFGNDEKLLSLFYTFFESLSLNRSYFLENWNHRKSFKERKQLLDKMKVPFVNFIDLTLGSQTIASLGLEQMEMIRDVCQRGQKEAFWIQMVCLIGFWEKDISQDQEKTDVAIEKSVRAAIDLMEAAPVRSVIDLGKFIWQEKRGH